MDEMPLSGNIVSTLGDRRVQPSNQGSHWWAKLNGLVGQFGPTGSILATSAVSQRSRVKLL